MLHKQLLSVLEGNNCKRATLQTSRSPLLFLRTCSFFSRDARDSSKVPQLAAGGHHAGTAELFAPRHQPSQFTQRNHHAQYAHFAQFTQYAPWHDHTQLAQGGVAAEGCHAGRN